jgi:hypothetical protein
MTGRGRQGSDSIALQSFKEKNMKHIFGYLITHQAAALWFSLTFMVSISAFALLEAFNRAG